MIPFKEKSVRALPFVLILGLAVFLRFYKIDQFQFDSDELSAIFRAQNAGNWQQHILNGILVDGHPAGVQTFIWFWINQFSAKPLPLKIITALFGLANVILTFIITKKIFGLKPAYFAMLCLSVLWWEVDLSLWVRPYIFGQFFTLATLWQLDISNKEGFANRSNWILIAIFTAGAFYTHHFASLTCFILIAYVFIFQRNKRKNIIKAFWLFCFLAIPQISIITSQLKLGGLDWLGKPDSTFFLNHIIYIFNNSNLFFILILYIVITGVFYAIKHKNISWKYTFVFSVLWLTPMLIGYFYSINFKPVLQNNVLFFSFPLLILSISNLFNGFKRNIYIAFMIIVATIGVIQIFIVKQRYSVEINEIYASQISTFNKAYNSESEFIIDGPIDVFQYQESRQSHPISLFSSSNIWMMSQKEWNWHDLYVSLNKMKGKSDLWFMSNAGTNPALRPLLYYYFENGTVHSNYIGGQVDKFNISGLNDTNYLTNIHKNHNEFPFMLANETSLSTNVNYTYSFSSDYFGKYIVNNHNLAKQDIQPNDLIVIKIDKTEFMGDAKIATAIINHESSLFSKSDKTEQIDYRFTNCNDFWEAGFGAAFHVLKLSDIPNWNQNSELRITIETSNKTIKNIPVCIYRFYGNPYQYGIN
jgi:hypothetical protein